MKMKIIYEIQCIFKKRKRFKKGILKLGRSMKKWREKNQLQIGFTRVNGKWQNKKIRRNEK